MNCKAVLLVFTLNCVKLFCVNVEMKLSVRLPVFVTEGKRATCLLLDEPMLLSPMEESPSQLYPPSLVQQEDLIADQGRAHAQQKV